MNPTTPSLLDNLLQGWQQLLTNCTSSGLLSRAAQEALLLEGEPEQLRDLVSEWIEGDFGKLPPVVLLPTGDMSGAAGAYAISTGTIYLNQDWLQSANRDQAVAVLTEELGHHLDGLLNESDTPGDEGELFAELLLGAGAIGEAERQVLRSEDDRGRVLVSGRELEVEQAAVESRNPISLGSFVFNASQFGDILLESDGGAFSSSNWLHENNSDPGNSTYLTGANFNTGIANIGYGANPVYTIIYGVPIVNAGGHDLGIVSARYSKDDTLQLSVSIDGINFAPPIALSPSSAIATGVNKSYYYAPGGTHDAELFVTPVDLSSFGISTGVSVAAIRITGSPEADLIRVAAFLLLKLCLARLKV